MKKLSFNKNKWKMFFGMDELPVLDSIIACQVPGLSLSTTERRLGRGFKFKDTGDELDFPALSISFIVDEYMMNYEVFQKLIKKAKNWDDGTNGDNSIQGSLSLLRDNGTERRKLKFQNLRCFSLDPIELAVNESDGSEYEISSVSFEYDLWDFVPLEQRLSDLIQSTMNK